MPTPTTPSLPEHEPLCLPFLWRVGHLLSPGLAPFLVDRALCWPPEPAAAIARFEPVVLTSLRDPAGEGVELLIAEVADGKELLDGAERAAASGTTALFLAAPDVPREAMRQAAGLHRDVAVLPFVPGTGTAEMSRYLEDLVRRRKENEHVRAQINASPQAPPHTKQTSAQNSQTQNR